MRFLVLCICVGYSIGAHIPKNEIALEKSDPLKQEPFEVISLDSQNSQEPLLIRSRIPESLRLKGGDLTNRAPDNTFSIPQVQSSSFNLVPAQLQFSFVGSSDFTSNEQKGSSSTKSVENPSSGTTDKPGYTIVQVPEVASFSKVGPLSPSDIPSFSQIEAIFNISSANKTVQDHSSDEYSQPIESRSGIEENNVKDEVTISSTEDLDAVTSDSLLDNITTSVSNITTNDIDEAKDVVTDPQPLSAARDLDLINTIENTEEIRDSPILSLFDVNTVVNDDVNITNDESTTVLYSTTTEESSLPEITTLDTEYINVYLSDINEDNTDISSNDIVNTSNFTGTEILSRSRAEENIEDATQTDLTTELGNAIETTTLEITSLSDIEDGSESTTTLYQETLIP